MISFETLFSAIIALIGVYIPICITLYIAKKNNPQLHIKHIVILIAVAFLLILFTAFALYFWDATIIYIETIGSFLAPARSAFSLLITEGAFSIKEFRQLFFCGLLPILFICVVLLLVSLVDVIRGDERYTEFMSNFGASICAILLFALADFITSYIVYIVAVMFQVNICTFPWAISIIINFIINFLIIVFLGNR